jgi:hypothetical protein
MRQITLELVDEKRQPLTEVELDDYGLPEDEEETEENLDNTGILKSISDLMETIFVKLAELHAEPLDPPVHVRVAIGDALFWACGSPETTPTVRIRVKINAET